MSAVLCFQKCGWGTVRHIFRLCWEFLY